MALTLDLVCTEETCGAVRMDYFLPHAVDPYPACPACGRPMKWQPGVRRSKKNPNLNGMSPMILSSTYNPE